MLQHNYSKLSSLESSRRSHQLLSTGNAFGASNLKLDRFEDLVVAIVSSSEPISDRTPSIEHRRSSSPLVIRAGKIILLSCWLWGSIGVTFCSNNISAIACSFSQDA
jgi:hypothetical protein